MKRLTGIIIFFVLMLSPLHAQKRTACFSTKSDTTATGSMTKTTWKDYLKLGRAFELDLKFFSSFGVTNMDHLAHTMLGAEFRYNFRRIPVDVGLSGGWSIPFSMEPVEAGANSPI